MADTVTGKLKDMGHKIAEGAEQATDWVKDQVGAGENPMGIRNHMDVIASCGTKIGVVDGVEGNSIKLTRDASPDGQHHYIPLGWVDRVDDRVYLTKNSVDAQQGWMTKDGQCGACSRE